jgi:hypothetical protein
LRRRKLKKSWKKACFQLPNNINLKHGSEKNSDDFVDYSSDFKQAALLKFILQLPGIHSPTWLTAVTTPVSLSKQAPPFITPPSGIF